jgi:hypothetical protein
MAEKNNWYYEKLDEQGKLRSAPSNDYDGKITGRIVFGVQAWFDENPEERIARGWVKHITHKTKDIEYDRATQYLVRQVKTVDAHTVEDVYHVANKSEEMMRLEELRDKGSWWDDDDVLVWGGDI